MVTLSSAFAEEPVDTAKKLAGQGLHKDAYDLVRPYILDPKSGEPDQAESLTQALSMSIHSLINLNRTPEIDELLESAAEVHKNHWRAIESIARHYYPGMYYPDTDVDRGGGFFMPRYGSVIDGKFKRGDSNDGGGGKRVNNIILRDRMRALQLMVSVLPLVQKDEDKKSVGKFFLTFSEQFMQLDAWKMQMLTDISTLPDYDTPWYYGGMDSGMLYGGYMSGGYGGGSFTPVDAEGNPVYYYVPESFESAKNDGERWRWALDQAATYNPDLQNDVLYKQAMFSESQFGERTLQSFDFYRNTEQEPKKTASILNLETLTDDETIAKLATGIKRFTLPDEFNYIKLYQKVGDAHAMNSLADIAKNRRQYPKAAEYYRKAIEKSDNPGEKKDYQRLLDQITGNWGRFERNGSTVAGLKADLRYVFRNGKKVKLTVQEINVEKLLADIKDYLKSKPEGLEEHKIQIDQIGYRLFHDEDSESVREKYIGKTIKEWEVELEPDEKHFDRSKLISFENEDAGAFVITAEMESGNKETALVWLEDTAIVKKQLDHAFLYYVADAETGKPIPAAAVNLFGYNRGFENGLVWTFRESTQKTDDAGMVIFPAETGRRDRSFHSLVTMTMKNEQGKKRTAHLGFDYLWIADRRYVQDDVEVKAFILTDRPVYRPKDNVQIKAWVGTATYDQPNTAEWAGKAVQYVIRDPRGEPISEKIIVLDEYGGLTAEWELPKDAALGQYSIQVRRESMNGYYYCGYVTFRVEEYKKPEYEVVIDAPKEPVMLGEKITATIKANYYFGSPVAEATVKYTVLREKIDAIWYPICPWDWFYGNGYGWFGYDCGWLPNWRSWGLPKPAPYWFPIYSGPPEVVAEAETRIKPDGTLDVVIDTAIAEEMFPDDSQKYTITAEVVDNSRRTIVGSGAVLVTKEPFKVYAWVHRGYFVSGQKIVANFQSRRLDGKPVSGKASVKVFRLTYETADRETAVTETDVHSASVTFSEEGKASLDLTAAAPGQYRLSCVLDGQEGGYVFNVYESAEDASTDTDPSSNVDSRWKYNDLELIPDKAEYAPDENVSLRINTDREESTVLLFIKPTHGVVAGKPKVLSINGKSIEVSIPVSLKDMPNFYVEALTVTGGKIVSEVKEIVVPPQQNVLNVEVKPSSETYKPGGKAKADLIVTDLEGKPITGQVAVTIYDKSVEYLSGGSNVGDIKEFFWKWRRQHYPLTNTNLERNWIAFNMSETYMEQLGIFGSVEMYNTSGGVMNMSSMMSDYGSGGMGGYSGGSVAKSGRAMRSMNAPMAFDAIAFAPQMSNLEVSESAPGTEVGGMDGGMLVEPAIRSNFADTALWIGALETDETGKAQIELDMPESLTTWKINVWSMALGTRVGSGSAEVITRKDFLLRMQTPRFLIEKDKVLFSANVHNYLATEKIATVSLETAEEDLQSHDMPIVILDPTLQTQTVTIPAGGEVRVDWYVEAVAAGNAQITMKALTDEESDAMQKTLPVYVHGMLKQDSYSAFIDPTGEAASFDVTVPEERKPEQTKLTVTFSPSLAATMIDALPYLVDYPYGCTEQTLNRFLPVVLVRKAIGSGWDLNVAKERDEQSSNRHPKKGSPVFDQEQIDDMVRVGITELVNKQCSDGGWGWFSGSAERSSGHMTALVIHGLQLAKSAGANVPDDVLRRGREWLKRYQDAQMVLLKNALIPDKQEKELRWKDRADEVDAFVFMVLAESAEKSESAAHVETIDSSTADMLEFLQRDRGKLSPYGVSMVGIAESDLPGMRDLTPYIKILEQYLVLDEENQTAYLNLNHDPGWRWWYWYGSEFETQAYYLKLLMRADSKSPVAPRLVKYLLNNRKHATYWNSTRDTAIVVEAFAEYLETTGEGKPYVTVELLVDGEVKKTVEFTPENFLRAGGTLVLENTQLPTGTHRVELRKKGNFPLYITGYLENFTLEDPITKAGLEVKAQRRIYKLIRDDSASTAVAGNRGQIVDLKTEKYRRVLINPSGSNGEETIKSGDLIEVELVIESKNDYESLLIEDWKPAGCEPVDLRSGYNGNELGAYVEFRDERVVFFVHDLSRGKHSVSYRLRAETPGEFSALPARIEAMYAPELKGNSDENKVHVTE